MKCPNCGFENAEGARFCRKCGTPIVNLTGNQAPQQRKAPQERQVPQQGYPQPRESGRPGQMQGGPRRAPQAPGSQPSGGARQGAQAPGAQAAGSQRQAQQAPGSQRNGVPSGQPYQPYQPMGPGQTPPKKSNTGLIIALSAVGAVVLILLIAIVIILIRRNANHSADASGQTVYEENSRRPSGADSDSKGESSMNPAEKQAENGSNGASGENASGEEASASKADASGSDGSADPSGASTSAAGESSAASGESAAAQQESSPGVPVIELSCGASFPQDIQIMVLSGYAISSLEELEQFPNLIQVDVRDTLVSSEAFAAYKAAHPQVELIGYSHSEYTVVKQDVTWDQAKALAEQAGGHLATLSDASELDLIIAQCQNMDLHYVWLGGYSDENRNWYWVTGEPWQDPGRWYPGEPTYIDEDGATENRLCLWNINEKGWTLNDQRNDLTGFNIVQGHMAYVIEKETQSGIR